MSRLEKLLKKLNEVPEDFKWRELQRLLASLGFREIQGQGSRVKFIHMETNLVINLHRPHPDSVLKKYMIRQILKKLKEESLI